MRKIGDYITVDDISVGEYSEKHSRFIATLYPAKSEEEVSEILATHRKKYFDARHNVYAYILKDNTARFSDDGEPHGTAGKPVLDVLSHSGITDAILICTRYFGGILLGTGGLVRAYSTASKQAVENAVPVKMTECSVFELNIPYQSQGTVMSLLKDIGADIIDTKFTDTVTIEFALLLDLVYDFKSKLREISSDKLHAEHKFNKILPKSVKK